MAETPQKRNKSSLELKQKVAKEAVKTSNRPAGRSYNIDEKLVIDWRKHLSKIE